MVSQDLAVVIPAGIGRLVGVFRALGISVTGKQRAIKQGGERAEEAAFLVQVLNKGATGGNRAADYGYVDFSRPVLGFSEES